MSCSAALLTDALLETRIIAPLTAAALDERAATQAAPGTRPHPAAAVTAPTRSFWLGASYVWLGTDAFEPSSRHGVGLGGSYEFHISPRFNLGLTLAYRLYPGAQTTQQLGYGASLRHFFSSTWQSQDGIYPFVAYGLLLQRSFVEGRSSSAVSHDTRLAAGALFRLAPTSWFVDVAGHYSRLEFFDQKSEFIPYLEGTAGWVLAF